MKKLIKGILIICTLIAIVSLMYIILLYPKHEYSESRVNDTSITLNDLIFKTIPKGFSGSDKKLETEITITEEDLENLVLNAYNDKNKLEKVDVIIEDSIIKVYAVKKYMDIFPVEISGDIEVKHDDYKMKLYLKDIKAGKIQLSSSSILENIKEQNIPFLDIKPTSREVVIHDETLDGVIEVSGVTADSKVIKIGLDFRFTKIESFINIVNKLKKN